MLKVYLFLCLIFYDKIPKPIFSKTCNIKFKSSITQYIKLKMDRNFHFEGNQYIPTLQSIDAQS